MPLFHSRAALTAVTSFVIVFVGCGGARPAYDDSSKNSGGSSSVGNASDPADSGGAQTTATGGQTSATGGQTTATTSGGTGNSTEVPNGGVAGTLIEIKPAWDYNGIVGTGQSLAVGNTPITSKSQPYKNLMLSLGTATVPPWNSDIDGLSLVPLIEVKNNAGYPAPYPTNRWGETPHSAMANQLTTLVRYASNTEFVSVHTVVGESGQGMVALKKQTGDTTGDTGRAYAASLFEVGAITRLAKSAGKTYGVGAIVMTHGETDSGSSTYENELIQLLADYNTDFAAITGQTSKIPMLISQQFAYPTTSGQRPLSTLVQWKLSVDRPGEFVCTGPKYQYPGHGDGIHLSAEGYKMLGEKSAQVYYERVVLGHDWLPLQPESVTREGRIVTVTFHVPVPPMVWESTFPEPTAWENGKGFELRRYNSKFPITSVEIVGNSVKITAGMDLPSDNVVVGYAMTSTGAQMSNASRAFRWGLLRDSDPFVGYATGKPNPNYSVAFDMPVP
jgi:hypothetical protein